MLNARPARRVLPGLAFLFACAPALYAQPAYFEVVRGAHPHDVAAAPTAGGPVYYTAQSTGKLGILDPKSARVVEIALGPRSAPHGVIVGPDGAAWITDGGQNAIVRVDPATHAARVWPLPADTGYTNLNTLTFDKKGLLQDFASRFPLVELGWVNEPEKLAAAYNAADLFLMPSRQEAFGMMAIEAMACGKPVLVVSGTALPETTFASEGAALCVEAGDSRAFQQALQMLVDDPAQRTAIGGKAREIAVTHYGEDLYVSRLLALYEAVVRRRFVSGGGSNACS